MVSGIPDMHSSPWIDLGDCADDSSTTFDHYWWLAAATITFMPQAPQRGLGLCIVRGRPKIT
jgi:hypothetical protein